MHKIFCTVLALASYAASQGVLGPPSVICEYDQGKTSLAYANVRNQRCYSRSKFTWSESKPIV